MLILRRRVNKICLLQTLIHLEIFYGISINLAISRREVICNRCYRERLLFSRRQSRADFLIRVHFPSSLISGRLLSFKGWPNRVAEVLKSMVARTESILAGKSVATLQHLPSFLGGKGGGLKAPTARDYDEFPGLRARFTY